MTDTPPDPGSGFTPSDSTSGGAGGLIAPANDGSDGKASSTKRQTTNVLGLGLPELATPSKPMTILSTYPHLGHYVHNLIATSHSTSPPRVPSGGQQQQPHQHPLSVSSSGESDDEDSDKPKGEDGKKHDAKDAVDRDALVKKIVDLLDNEEEEQVKDLLKPYMGDLAKVSSAIACMTCLPSIAGC